MNRADGKKLVTEIFYASQKAVDPYESVKGYADKIRFDLGCLLKYSILFVNVIARLRKHGPALAAPLSR